MVLGGTKVDDSIDVARHVLANGIADQVIVIGVVANVFLIAAGYNIGKPSTQLIAQLKYQPEIEKAKEILSRYRDRVVMPDSVAVRQDNHRVEYPVDKIPEDTPVLDLGMDALASLVQTLKKAGPSSSTGLPVSLRMLTLPPEPMNCSGQHRRSSSRLSEAVIPLPSSKKLGIEHDFTHISTGGGAASSS